MEVPRTVAVSTLVVPYSMERGVLIGDPELGLAALEFSRGALRGSSGRVEIEVDVEPDLIASIAAIRTLVSPTVEERREAVIREDILDRARSHARELERALTILLTEPSLASVFGYDEELFAEAIRRAAPGRDERRNKDDVSLQAWPSYDMERPIITFDIPQSAMDQFYAQHPMNRELIRMGGLGGQMVGDLPSEVIASRFLPILANRLVGFADTCGMEDAEAL